MQSSLKGGAMLKRLGIPELVERLINPSKITVQLRRNV